MSHDSRQGKQQGHVTERHMMGSRQCGDSMANKHDSQMHRMQDSKLTADVQSLG